MDSETTLKQEIAWASHLSLQVYIFIMILLLFVVGRFQFISYAILEKCKLSLQGKLFPTCFKSLWSCCCRLAFFLLPREHHVLIMLGA